MKTCTRCGKKITGAFVPGNTCRNTQACTKRRLEYLRGELRAERISQGELCELTSLASFIEPGDVELLEAAGVPEFPQEANHTPGPWTDDDPCLSIETQAQMLVENIGTDQEWQCVGPMDEDGISEVVALCHPRNARLIASAPELLSALQMCSDFIRRAHGGEHMNEDERWAMLADADAEARAAIAKATGKD